MKISNIKYQISKIYIKNQIFLIFNVWLLLLASPLYVFAHESEMPHEEPVPTISPLLLVGFVAVLAICGFLLWRFVLRSSKSSSSNQATLKNTPPTEEKTVSQNGESEVSSQDK